MEGNKRTVYGNLDAMLLKEIQLYVVVLHMILNQPLYLRAEPMGSWESWTSWSPSCSKTCGGGYKYRTRHCTKLSYGNQYCYGSSFQSTNCNTNICPINGNWGSWNSWSSCSQTCGGGYMYRNRKCDNPPPSTKSMYCTVEATLTKRCNITICPLNGNWGSWNSWSTCSQTCGGGYRKRDRRCDNPPPSIQSLYCTGSSYQTEICNMLICQVNGNWGSWNSWSTCSQTCGGGYRKRDRRCDNPPPSIQSLYCTGSSYQTEICNMLICQVNGNWGSWNLWSTCSQTCGGGYRKRDRRCDNPPPSKQSLYCSGVASQTETCNNAICTVNGNWGSWNLWSTCSQTCGGGHRNRNRQCDNPPPSTQSLYCTGSSYQTEICITPICQVNGNWGSWNSWSSCSQTCGGGYMYRNRKCDKPPPSTQSMYCSGEASQTKRCNVTICPVNGNWGSWNSWSFCSQTCGGGHRNRNRRCDNPPPSSQLLYCSGIASQTETCNNVICTVNGNWGSWNLWSTCSQTCGGGHRNRNRRCDNPPPSTQSLYCSGSSYQTEICNMPICQVNGNWGSWNWWSACSRTCGGGYRNRNRRCDNPPPSTQSLYCSGSSSQIGNCNSIACPVDGSWEPWSPWEDCNVSCGHGSQRRTRQCINPPPFNGGVNCIGMFQETINCTLQPCPVDGAWSEWSYWTECNVTCDGGVKNRTRTCDSPQPASNGTDCVGDAVESNSCNYVTCPAENEMTYEMIAVVAGSGLFITILVVLVVEYSCAKIRKRKGNQQKYVCSNTEQRSKPNDYSGSEEIESDKHPEEHYEMLKGTRHESAVYDNYEASCSGVNQQEENQCDCDMYENFKDVKSLTSP